MNERKYEIMKDRKIKRKKEKEGRKEGKKEGRKEGRKEEREKERKNQSPKGKRWSSVPLPCFGSLWW